jgi:hypothetical protein
LPRAQDFQCVWFFPGPWLERAELDRKIQTLARWSSSSSGNLDIESFLDWIYEEEMMMDEKSVKLLAYRCWGGASACLVGSSTKESSATRKSASERLPFTTLRPRRSSKLPYLIKERESKKKSAHRGLGITHLTDDIEDLPIIQL